MRRLGRRGWAVLIAALLTAPVPYGGLESGLTPPSWLTVAALVAAAVGIVEGGGAPWTFAALLGAQAMFWTTLLAVAVRLLLRRAERLVPPGQGPWVSLVACAGFALLAVTPVYRSSMANTEGWTNLRGLWRPVRNVVRVADDPIDPQPLGSLGGVVEDHTACLQRTSLRRAYFGDLHVHTRLSLDASTQGTRTTPADAYRFGRGEVLGLQPHDSEGRPLRTAQLARPLDFVAVTDHAELFGEVRICETPGLPGHDSLMCSVYRRWPRGAFYMMNAHATSTLHPERHRFCGPRDIYCLEAALTPWREVQQAASAAYERCEFSTFVAYEWTGAPDSRNLHRNVIFRTAVVPNRPISYVEAPTPSALWRQLARHCTRRLPGCEALAIPHNSNLSGGTMFAPAPGQEMTASHARAWRAAEPLVEIMQHKGDSECLPGSGAADEHCGFEKLPYDRFSGKFNRLLATAPTGAGFVRDALADGLRWHAQLGENPFRFGIIASTDTHLGTPGMVAESAHLGHGGAGIAARERLPPGLPDDVEFNPGGLAVLWAEENTREALFEAMRRREVYGTSGPRLTVRVFGSWGYSASMCGTEGFVERGYEEGVPMGSILPSRPADVSDGPTFAVWAIRDAGTASARGTPLQQVQIVKGWIEGGEVRTAVTHLTGDADGNASVDLSTCTPEGDGYDSLCGTWTDPAFDAGSPAFYYVRVLENPSCRWTTWICNAKGVDCGDRSTVTEGLDGCCDDAYPKTIQERAWTSPIWYVPPDPLAPLVEGEERAGETMEEDLD